MVLNGFFIEVVYIGGINMRTKVKRLITILLALAIVISLATTVSAVEPRYSYTDHMIVGLVFFETTANCSVSITGADGVTSIDNVNITLTDSKGNLAGTWSNLSSTGQDFYFFDTVPNLKKGEHYTLTVSAKVHAGNKSETITGTATNDCPA